MKATAIKEVVITHRQLRADEALTLHNELKTTPNILGFTVRELVRLRDVQVAEVDGAFAGAALSMDMTLGWTEIAAVYVLPDRRGAGAGKQLLNAAWDRAERRGRHIYMLSRNLQVVEWMRGKGMTINSNMMLAPVAVQLFMPIYMASWHRNLEALRKSRAINKGPKMVQGMKKYTGSPIRS